MSTLGRGGRDAFREVAVPLTIWKSFMDETNLNGNRFRLFIMPSMALHVAILSNKYAEKQRYRNSDLLRYVTETACAVVPFTA